MHAALLGRILLPPPTAGPGVLARLHGTGARRAAHADVAFFVERVAGYAVDPDVVPDLVGRPIGQGVEFDNGAVVVVQLDLADVDARGPLIAAQAGDPGVHRLQGALERAHLTHLAA